MWMYFFHFFFFLYWALSMYQVHGLHASPREIRAGNRKTSTRDYYQLRYMLWGGWRESLSGGRFRPAQSCWSLGVGEESWRETGPAPENFLFLFYLAALKRRNWRQAVWRCRGAVQGEEEAGERPRLRVWEGDPRAAGPSRCGNGGLGSQSDQAVPLASAEPSHLLPERVKRARLVMSPYESFLEPHSHLDEQSQAKRPPRGQFPHSHRQVKLSSRHSFRAACSLLRLPAPLRGWVPPARTGWRRLDWCPAAPGRVGNPLTFCFGKSKKLDPGTALRRFQCMWCDGLSGVRSVPSVKCAGI